MYIIVWITAIIAIGYMLYPIFLMISPKICEGNEEQMSEILCVTLILLTYNGKEYVKEKIKFLHEELSSFLKFEFIVIDDCSFDGTQLVLKSIEKQYNLKVICKNEHNGIANSMNLSVKAAKYNHIIFCDQRQELSKNILQKIVKPLQNSEIGAVSGFISYLDKDDRVSFIRKHENKIKTGESKMGCLIGVYGPLYAINKCCYSEIPEYIILDDLYLSLKILKNKKIVLMRSCKIIDECFTDHYNLKRTTRYLEGLIQILLEKGLFWSLSPKIKLMLIWHKYIRLLIPSLFLLSYLSSALISRHNIITAFLFWGITILFAGSILLRFLNIQTFISEIIRTSLCYFLSWTTFIFQKLIYKSFTVNKILNIK
jgi:glycosyltransferase involved in cell wall biosynthesis